MPFDIGINFRATDTYVTDGAGETYCILNNYPTTQGGATFGWESPGLQARDRDSGADRRLAGINFASSQTFRLDLPATGSYEVRLAAGDYAGGQAVSFTVQDGTTDFITISGSTSAAEFFDATNTLRTAAAWPGSNVAVTRTFASTVLRFSPVGTIFVAHLRVTESSGATHRVGGPLIRRGRSRR